MGDARVLVVEDEFVVAAHIEGSLSTLGYEVVGTAATREDAVRLAGEFRPDIVLMDIQLATGQMEGIQAAREIRERYGLPVVYLTAHSDPDTLQEAKLTEPYGYVLKPFSERELYSVIETGLFKHRVQSELQEQQEWLATVLRSIGDGVIATDVEGRVKLLNRVAEELTGWPLEEARGRPLVEVFRIINEHTREPCEDPVMKVLETGLVVGLANHTALIARDGVERCIADSGAPIRDAQSRIVGAVLVFRDVTLEKRLEQRMQMAQRLDSVGVLAGGIAHDFNNMLAGIMLHASLGRIQAARGEDVREIFEEIEQDCARARGLTQQLLTFASGGVPLRKPTVVAAMLRSSGAFALRGQRSELHFELPEELWASELDEGQIGQVVTNLVLNADAAMPDGGSVWIRASNRSVRDGDPEPLAPGSYVVFSVEDSGIGIPPELLDRIFEPYYTTKGAGRGLGLASCYSIVEGHGGHISVTSTPGRGSRFDVLLPALDQVSVDALQPPGPIRSKAGGPRILLMDDEPAVRQVSAVLLGEHGYEVETAPDGEAAVVLFEQASREGRPFAAVILDLTVPGGMGGVEALELLRDISPEVRAIASSGYATDPIMSEHRAHGFSAAIPKPYSLDDITRVLGRVLAD